VTHNEYRKALEKLNLSQVGAARMLGVDGRTSRRWIAGEVPIPHAVSIVLTVMRKCKLSSEDVIRWCPAKDAE
jgi:hypothetical protein